MVKNGCHHSSHENEALKLSISQEGIDEINCFLHAATNSGMLKLLE